VPGIDFTSKICHSLVQDVDIFIKKYGVRIFQTMVHAEQQQQQKDSAQHCDL